MLNINLFPMNWVFSEDAGIFIQRVQFVNRGLLKISQRKSTVSQDIEFFRASHIRTIKFEQLAI